MVRANNREEFIAGAARLKRLLDSPEIRATREPHLDQLLVEGYLEGREVAVEALLTEGVPRVLAIFDKPDPLEGPYFEETIYVTPSQFPGSSSNAPPAIAAACGARARPDARTCARGISPEHAGCLAHRSSTAPNRRPLRACATFCFAGRSGHDRPGRIASAPCTGVAGHDAPREADASGVMMIPVPNSGILERMEGVDAARPRRGSRAWKSQRVSMTSSPRGRKARATWDFYLRKPPRSQPKWKMPFVRRTENCAFL